MLNVENVERTGETKKESNHEKSSVLAWAPQKTWKQGFEGK